MLIIKIFRRILALSGKYRGRIEAAFVCAFFESVLSKAPIFFAFYILGKFYYGSIREEDCLFTGICLVVSVLLQALLHYERDRLQSTAGYMMFADMRLKSGDHLRRLPMGYFAEGNTGNVSSALSTDMVFIEETAMSTIADMLNYAFVSVIMLLFMAFINPALGLAALTVTALAAFLAEKMNRLSVRESDLRQRQSKNLTDAVLSFTEGIAVIKSYNLTSEKSKELTENFKRSRDTSTGFEKKLTPYTRRLDILYGAGMTAIFGLSVFMWQAGELSLPYLTAVLLFVFTMFAPLKALYGEATRLTVMNSCLDRIEAVLSEKELPEKEPVGDEPVGNEPFEKTFKDFTEKEFSEKGLAKKAIFESEPLRSKTEGENFCKGNEVFGKEKGRENKNESEISFKNVTFSYGTKEVLHDISFDMKKNQMTALVGPSGSGKTTLANLLARFWDTDGGSISVRGKDIRDYAFSELMDMISMVFQRTYLFNDTIKNNIRFGNPGASDEEIYEAAKKARCYDFIMELPEGFDTMAGEGGEMVSGGEKQRISIARCILKDAPIVIFDEATANVDADNESYIKEAVTELVRGKTLLVIAHRLNTIRNANNIIVLSDGRIADSGTHEELIKKNGIYRDFVTERSESEDRRL